MIPFIRSLLSDAMLNYYNNFKSLLSSFAFEFLNVW